MARNGRLRSGVGSVRRRSAAVRQDVTARIEERRSTAGVVDFVMRLIDRDRETDGSVVASAVALRVFLFFLPMLLVVVGLAGFVRDHVSDTSVRVQTGVTGGLAAQINQALHQSNRARWLALLSGLFAAVLAGRSLAKVLTAASRRAWRLPPKSATSSSRVAAAIAGLVTAAGILAVVANRVRNAAGIVGGSMTLVAAALLYAVAWFVVSVMLPRGPVDRSALLPGALFVGVSLAVTQWVLQFELPGRVSRASQLYGAIGIVIVTLSWFFIIGRLFVLSFTIDAVTSERFGSLTTSLLSWKPLRKLVDRFPRFERFLTSTPKEIPLSDLEARAASTRDGAEVEGSRREAT